ncbi:MAG: hypothetical protein UH853_06410 [Muribaculaceae bacterium]|nr:hypothetical protein [Muribaculaceae bacterium]
MNKVSITINGTRYDSVEDNDNDIDICKRCALNDYCIRLDEVVLCNLFGMEINENFKAVKDNIKDNPKGKGNLKVQIEFTDGSSRCYHIGSLDEIIADEWVTLINIDGVKETINTSNIKTIREAKFV